MEEKPLMEVTAPKVVYASHCKLKLSDYALNECEMEVPEDDYAEMSDDACQKDSIRYRRVPVINQEEFDWFYNWDFENTKVPA